MIPRLRLFKRHEFTERWSLVVVVLAIVLPLAGMAAYRVLEHEQPGPATSMTSLASLPTLPSLPKFKSIVEKFRKNETITDALTRHGLTKQQVLDLVQTTLPIYPLSKVLADREYRLNFWSETGEFNDFNYAIDDNRYLTVYHDGDKFVPLLKKFEYETRIETVLGVIDDSLFLAVTRAGEQEQFAVDLSNIFAWDVDFNTEIQKGDSFRVLLEKKYLDGKFVKYGNVLAADLLALRKRFSAFRFENEYYDAGGKALKKSLLKSPLPFAARITSRFSRARMHPILKIVRPHLGVDYGAPSGTPVVAVASGRVISAGWDGGFGKSVRLRHSGGLETVYSHLSIIRVRVGAQVAQSQVIGNVGATGLATGPHLDFRLMQGRSYISPTKKIVPDAPPVGEKAFPRFAALRDDLRGRLDSISGGTVAVVQAGNSNSAEGRTSK